MICIAKSLSIVQRQNSSRFRRSFSNRNRLAIISNRQVNRFRRCDE